MENEIKSSFCFDSYRIDLIKFDINSEYIDSDSEVELDIELDVILKERFKERQGIVTLVAKIFKDAKMRNYPFELNLSISGLFMIEDEKMPLEEFVKFLKVNGTTAMFPFLRSAIADVTRIANVDTLVLPLININNLIEKQNKEK